MHATGFEDACREAACYELLKPLQSGAIPVLLGAASLVVPGTCLVVLDLVEGRPLSKLDEITPEVAEAALDALALVCFCSPLVQGFVSTVCCSLDGTPRLVGPTKAISLFQYCCVQVHSFGVAQNDIKLENLLLAMPEPESGEEEPPKGSAGLHSVVSPPQAPSHRITRSHMGDGSGFGAATSPLHFPHQPPSGSSTGLLRGPSPTACSGDGKAQEAVEEELQGEVPL